MLTTLFSHLASGFFTIPLLGFLVNTNKLVVTGREHVTLAPNTLFIANHRCFLDPFVVLWATFGYRALWSPRLTPYAPIGAELVTTPFRRFVLYNCLHCVPVTRGVPDVDTLDRMQVVLQRASMIMFPEGRITANNWVQNCKMGPAKLICESRPTVIPVFLDGAQDVLPLGVGRPRIGQTVYANIGAPLKFGEDAKPGAPRSVWKEISRQMTNTLRELETAHYAAHPERRPTNPSPLSCAKESAT